VPGERVDCGVDVELFFCKKVKRKNISSGPLIVLKINNESVKST
jgi:hypothetical protein